MIFIEMKVWFPRQGIVDYKIYNYKDTRGGLIQSHSYFEWKIIYDETIAIFWSLLQKDLSSLFFNFNKFLSLFELSLVIRPLDEISNVIRLASIVLF